MVQCSVSEIPSCYEQKGLDRDAVMSSNKQGYKWIPAFTAESREWDQTDRPSNWVTTCKAHMGNNLIIMTEVHNYQMGIPWRLNIRNQVVHNYISCNKQWSTEGITARNSKRG